MKALNLIVAVSANGVIGNAGKIPWRCKENMAFFKRTTTGHAVIMGRKTWDSLPAKARPLPGRENIILSRSLEAPSLEAVAQHPSVTLCTDLDLALECAYSLDGIAAGPPFIIGGAEIYRLAMPLVTTAYVTTIRERHDGDATFPIWELLGWDAHREWETEQAECNRWERCS